ncbi:MULTISPECIES: SDR family NAD(P)-dependent oxidoreductase [Pseudomonas]|uniref:SDR family NAD(P)-dependent oxidoreductase n=1 Tax=Pseudomonas TaxID=286 RepID=UPI0007092A22|nr:MULTISPECIES: SDR family NAD(P)-dependent oxidoreductase [Pseudomonas]KQW33012.1 short-chain dehydrogenase [Pseudomonas sp. Root401]WHS56207.1 SDR family NAD(P)-dependent oxidoreductase [Pseudomonas brassicacearum]
MRSRFDDRVVVITGGNGGIGAATARAFVAERAHVVLVDKVIDENLLQTLIDAGTESSAYAVDVADAEQCRGLIENIIQKYGRIDVLFNNAGITRRASVVDTTVEEWDQVINVNLRSIFLMSKFSIPHMQRQGGGNIVNTASGWGLVGGAKAASYCASKGGVVLLTKAMAIDHGADNIRVNCICPGDTLTPMLFNEAEQLGLEKNSLVDAAVSRPLGRAGLPSEIANAVLFLASDDSSFITGEGLVVDGGGLAGSA